MTPPDSSFNPAGQPDPEDVSGIVRWMWSRLRHRSRADRHHVYSAVCGTRAAQRDGRVQFVLTALRRFPKEVPLSKRRWEAWRAAQPDKDDLPSATMVANTFGGWGRAAEAVGLRPGIDVLARRLTQPRIGATREQLLDCLKACAAALGKQHFTFREYEQWARAEIDSKQSKLPVIVISSPTFRTKFGSWTKAMIAAGLERPTEVNTRPKVGSRGFTDQEVRQAVLDCAGTLGATPKKHEYVAWRDGQLKDEATRRPIPSPETLCARFGRWHQVLAWAGLRDDAPHFGERNNAYPDQVLIAAVRDCAAALGQPPNRNQYRRWRLTADGQQPSDSIIVARFGGWQHAVQAAGFGGEKQAA